MKISLPANVFVAALRGNQNVLDMYDANDVAKMLEANWEVVGCNFNPAAPRAGITDALTGALRVQIKVVGDQRLKRGEMAAPAKPGRFDVGHRAT
jgi:hypothetical protein